MLDCHCSVVRVGHQLAGGTGSSAEILEDIQVTRPGMDDTSIGPGDQLADEAEDLVVG